MTTTEQTPRIPPLISLPTPKHRVEFGDPMDTSSSSSNDDPSLENRLRRPLEGVVVEKDTDECDDDRDDTDEKEGEEFGEDGMWVFLRFVLNKRAFKSLDLGCFFVICLE